MRRMVSSETSVGVAFRSGCRPISFCPLVVSPGVVLLVEAKVVRGGFVSTSHPDVDSVRPGRAQARDRWASSA